MTRIGMVTLLLFITSNAWNQQLNIHMQCSMDSIWIKEMQVNKVKAIIGNWVVLAGEDTVYKKTGFDVYQFIDGQRHAEFDIQVKPICCQEITKIEFQLGVDSLTHYKEIGCCGLEPGDDMYWTWQSGYIGFKLEGKDAKSNNWQYHLGGFHWPLRADQKIEFYTDVHQQQSWSIDLHLSKQLFDEMNHPPYKVMSPGKSSQNLMKSIASSIIITPRDEE